MRLNSLKPYLLDLIERVAKTFGAGVAALWAASALDLWPAVTNMAALDKIGLAGFAAGATLLIGIFTRFIGGTDSVSVFEQLSVESAEVDVERAITDLKMKLQELHPVDATEARRLENVEETVSGIERRLIHQ